MVLALFLLSSSALSQEPNPKTKPVLKPGQKAEPKKVKPPKSKDSMFKRAVVNTSASVSNRIEKTANSIDITLAGKKYTKKPNTTSIDVNQYVTWTEGKLKNSTDFGVDLRLPNLERRWQLRFSSYDQEAENRDISQQRVRTRPRERDYGAALFFFKNLGRIRTTFQPRLQLKDPLEMNYVLRFESSATQDKVRLVPRVDLFADAKKGTGQFVSLALFVDITDRLEFVWQNSEEYRERENVFETQHGLALDYSLNTTSAVGLSTSMLSRSRPAFHAVSYTVSSAYTKQIYKDLLKYSLSPFLLFSKSVHFKGEPGITLNLNLVF